MAARCSVNVLRRGCAHPSRGKPNKSYSHNHPSDQRADEGCLHRFAFLRSTNCPAVSCSSRNLVNCAKPTPSCWCGTSKCFGLHIEGAVERSVALQPPLAIVAKSRKPINRRCSFRVVPGLSHLAGSNCCRTRNQRRYFHQQPIRMSR